jgi:hypothetical protein
MLCQCWSYFFHWTNINKMSNVLLLYQCHFKTCCYNVTLTSYQWLYQHWTLNILLRCCKNIRTKRGQVCDEGFFLVALFNFLKSTQIFCFPFFLGNTTIGDNHVASSTCWMNFVANSLSIFFFQLQNSWNSIVPCLMC